MPDVDLGPLLKPDDTLSFVESHRPALEDGSYTVTVKHTAQHGQAEPLLAAERSLRFVVAGPRFVLAPNELASRFPPPGASGHFANVLPHLMLRRPSLPWERSATPDQGRKGPPWLALLVLTPAEVLNSETIKASTLMAPTAPKVDHFLPLPKGAGDDPGQTVQVIDIDVDLARQILPDAAELALLSGVRLVNEADGRAMVVAKRLPEKNMLNQVHLVSLEHQYLQKKGGGAVASHEHWSIQSKSKSTPLRLVSLAQWEFFCLEDGDHLKEILQAITIRRPVLVPTASISNSGPVEAGAVPLQYRQANGQRSAAWYHGPLAARAHGVVLPLPARRADELLLLERATGMPDISYGAAWELGRMLALRDPAVGIRLNQWKRQVAHAGHAAKWIDRAPQGVALDATSPLFALGDWFENALARLASVPFSYLLPEPAMLAPESLIFFHLDLSWIAALFDGAFSIGRHNDQQRNADRELRQVLPVIRPRSGVLLRSQAVAGWPDLVVEGQAAPGKIAQVLRFERLASDTLLVLFEGLVHSVFVHPHPQALHFGFDAAAQGEFVNGNRAVLIEAYASKMGAKGSHDFAPKMLAPGLPKVNYSVQGGGFG